MDSIKFDKKKSKRYIIESKTNSLSEIKPTKSKNSKKLKNSKKVKKLKKVKFSKKGSVKNLRKSTKSKKVQKLKKVKVYVSQNDKTSQNAKIKTSVPFKRKKSKTIAKASQLIVPKYEGLFIPTIFLQPVTPLSIEEYAYLECYYKLSLNWRFSSNEESTYESKSHAIGSNLEKYVDVIMMTLEDLYGDIKASTQFIHDAIMSNVSAVNNLTEDDENIYIQMIVSEFLKTNETLFANLIPIDLNIEHTLPFCAIVIAARAMVLISTGHFDAAKTLFDNFYDSVDSK
jgi:hypothetical protein